MFGSLVSSLANTADVTKSKMIMYMVIAIVVIVIVGVLLDGVRKFIRGLDTAVLGGLFLWLAYKSWSIPVISALAEFLLAAGATLVVVGLIVFIINRMVRRGRAARYRSGKHDAVVEPQTPLQQEPSVEPEPSQEQ